MRIELESLVWDRKVLQDQLHTAIKECRILEAMLAEVEEENDTVISRIELLEREVVILSFFKLVFCFFWTEENLCLYSHAFWSNVGCWDLNFIHNITHL